MTNNKKLKPLQRRLDFIRSVPTPNDRLLQEAASLRWAINQLASQEAECKDNENAISTTNRY